MIDAQRPSQQVRQVPTESLVHVEKTLQLSSDFILFNWFHCFCFTPVTESRWRINTTLSNEKTEYHLKGNSFNTIGGFIFLVTQTLRMKLKSPVVVVFMFCGTFVTQELSKTERAASAQSSSLTKAEPQRKLADLLITEYFCSIQMIVCMTVMSLCVHTNTFSSAQNDLLCAQECVFN